MRKVQGGSSYRPISDYGIIGDMHSCALVSSLGSIDWCCFPRFDSPSIFAALLDSKKGGSFSIAPAIEFSSSPSYIRNTNILRTLFTTKQGKARLIDFMPCYMEKGSLVAHHEIIRKVEGVEGKVPMLMSFAPRLDYARGETELECIGRLGLAKKGDERLSIYSSLPMEARDGSLEVGFTIKEGEALWFIVRYGDALGEGRPEPQQKLDRTASFWRTWAQHCTYKGRWREQVVRSALVLKLLQYAPTGALVAAATTSLPEALGGSRNWDYRFSWLRDSAFSLYALIRIGQYDEASHFLDWFLSLARKSGVNLQIMYGVDGERHLKEEELSHLEGYRGSYPVRVGNAAYEQFQLDVYGIVVDATYFSHRYVRGLKDIYEEIRNLVDFVTRIWHSKDNGVWEIRGEPRHYVYSKVWAYVALDRGIRLAKELGYFDDAVRWQKVKERVRDEIMRRGWSEAKKAFTMYYGSKELDAATLLMPLVGFLPADHPKMLSTIERIIEELSQDGLVRRYKAPDNLHGEEGAFIICSFWLVDCLTKLGRLDEALRLFKKLLSYANHLGLYSEEIDLKTGEALGNFPQAYTHMALISSAINLDRALSEAKRVRDIMETKPLELEEDASALEAAKLIGNAEAGCVMVMSKGRPKGIVTERDLISRVLARSLDPSKVRLKEVMSSPLLTIQAEGSLEEAAKIMAKEGVRRLGVMEKDKLVGLLTASQLSRSVVREELRDMVNSP